MNVDFFDEALATCPQPAAVYELDQDGHATFLASNAVAKEFFEKLYGSPEAYERAGPADKSRLIGLDYDAMRERLAEDAFSQRVTDGVVHASRLDAQPTMPRPPLAIVTVHLGVDDRTAWIDHKRVLATVSINEIGTYVLDCLRNAEQQVQAVVSAQRALLNVHNEAITAMFAMNTPERLGETFSPDA